MQPLCIYLLNSDKMPKKAKSKLKVLEFADPVYKNGFVLLAGTHDEVVDYLQEQQVWIYEPDYEQDGCCYNKWCDSYICIFEDDISVIVHECIHAAQFAMDYRGVNTWIDNTEVLAHLTQWIFQEALPFFNNYFAKLKKDEK